MSAASQQHAEAQPQQLTTRDLMGPRFTGGPRVVDDSRRVLVVGGLPVATLGPDPSRINPLCARSATGMPVIEMLAAIASQDPTGVLTIESADEQRGFAFHVHRGKVVSAKGPGELGQLEPWCAAVHQRFPERFGCAPDADDRRADPSWIRVAKAFVGERALDHLELALVPGSQLTFVRGDVEWIGTSMVYDGSPSLSHLLLEHARRSDERPRLLEHLGELDQVVVPLSEPSSAPTTPGEKASSDGDDDDDWDFFDDPDPAALEEWEDAKALWPLCDGQHSIEEVIEFSMLGRFRALAAVAALASRQHVLIANATSPGENTETDDDEAATSSPQGQVASVVELRSRPSSNPNEDATASASRTSAPRSLAPQKPTNTGYALQRGTHEIARVVVPKRNRRAPTAGRRNASVFPTLPNRDADLDVAAAHSGSDEVVDPGTPAAVSRISSAAIQTVKRDPNLRLIAIALAAALLFVAGAAAAVMVSRSLQAPAAPGPTPSADPRD